MTLKDNVRRRQIDWFNIGRIALFCVPLLLALLWINVISAEAYTLWFVIQRLAGAGFSAETGLTTLVAPLFAFPLLIAQLTGLTLFWTAPILSALGWSLAALLMFELLRKRVHLFIAGLATFLLVLSPVMTLTTGTAVGWTVAFLLLGVLATWQAHWRWQLIALIGILGTSFTAAGGVAVLFLLIVRWQTAERRQAVWGIGVVTAFALLWGVFSLIQFGVPAPDLASNAQEWLALLNELLSTTALFWLYVPLAIVGIIAFWQNDRSLTVVGATVIVFLTVILSDPLLGLALTAVLILMLIALGIGFVQGTVSAESHPLARAIVLPLILTAPLLLASFNVLRHQKTFTSQRILALEEQVADWLDESTTSDATLLASARIGYLADRLVAVDSAAITARDSLSLLFPDLVANPPDYVVADRAVEWDSFIHQNWFQNAYDLIVAFEDSAEPTAPLTIWQRIDTDLPVYPLVTDMPVGANLVGYTVAPTEIAPGDGVRLNLLWEAVASEIDTFQTIVRIVSPIDGAPYAQRDLITPRSVPASWWQPDMTIREQFVLTTTADISVGAYAINVSIREPRSNELLRMTANNDSNPIDHFVLGYIAVPPVVTETGVQPVSVRFGDEISLLNATIDGAFEAGNTLNVELFWEALRMPDADYTVFVQLLDTAGNLVASGDGRPMNGAYTTLAWQPDTVIPDTHLVQLPPELGAAEYVLQVGLYRADTGARLAAFSAENAPLPNDAVILKQFPQAADQ